MGLGSRAAGRQCAICGVSRGLWTGSPQLGERKEGAQRPGRDVQRPETSPKGGEGLLRGSGKGWMQGAGWGGVLGAHLPRGCQPPPCRCPPSVSPAVSVPRGSTRTPAGSVCPPRTARASSRGCPTPGVPSSTPTVRPGEPRPRPGHPSGPELSLGSLGMAGGPHRAHTRPARVRAAQVSQNSLLLPQHLLDGEVDVLAERPLLVHLHPLRGGPRGHLRRAAVRL